MSYKYVRWVLIYMIIFALVFTAKLYAQEDATPSENSPRRYFNAYIYPASLILTCLMLPDSDNDKDSNYTTEKTEKDRTYFTNIYLTFEFIPINPLSIIITPSYQGWNFTDEGYEDKGKLNHDRIGGDLGLRLYFTGNPNLDGFFIQATGGMYYFSRDINYKDNSVKTASYRAVLYQGMGYIGYKYGVACFSIGAGYNYYKDKKLSYKYKDERYDLREDMAQRGFAIDVSLSIGLFYEY
ncbi:MAG: hypothetical protein V1874_06440 [Spirochaetota bacterium]